MSEQTDKLKLLVVAGERSFGRSVATAVRATEPAVHAVHVEGGAAALGRVSQADIDAAVVDDQVADPVPVVERLASERDLPVAVLSSADGESLDRLLEAGAVDVFPRVAATAQYDIVVDRLADARGPAGTDPGISRAAFEQLADGVVLHEPDTGEIRDANERFCELVGYSREELLGETVDLVTPDDGTDTYEQARPQEGPQLFEWRQQHRDGHTFPVEAHLTAVTVGDCERVLTSVRDITERKRREREYEQIFDNVNDAIAVHDAETGAIVDINDSYLDLCGYDRETVLEAGMDELSATEEGYTDERARELVTDVAERGTDETVEWRVETADGERRTIESTLTVVELGGQQRVLSLIRDVTEQRRRQRQLELIVERIDEAVYLVGSNGEGPTYLSPAYESLTGLSIDQLHEDPWSFVEHVHPDDRQGYRDFLDRIEQEMEAGDPQDSYTIEYRFERPDGETRWHRATGYPLRDSSSYTYIGVLEDVTERKRREREYEQIFDGVNDAIAVFDPETAEIVDVNERYHELLGYDDLERIHELGIEGLSVTEAGYTGERGHHLIAEVAETGEPQTVEWQAKQQNGERIWLEVTLATAEIGGESRVLSIQRDVTERKRRERAIRTLERATERLQSAQTPAEVTRVATEAASDALDLPMSVCWVYDETADRLEPVAATDTAHEAGLVTPLGPDRYEYEVFSEGGITEYVPGDHSADNPLQTGVLLPLTDHGLVAAGCHEATDADRIVLDVAKALADHVTTALDRVKGEQAVRESERRFRMIAERVDEIIYLSKPDFSEVLYVNPAYEEVYGQTVETLHDDPTAFLDPIDDRDRERFESEFEEMLAEIEAGESQDSYEFEFRIRQPGGEVRWLSATGYLVEPANGTRRFVGIVNDITERKRREQRLEVFNRILRHNLRNQLDVIRSHAEVLADQTTGDHAGRIIAAVDELAGIGARARNTDRIMSMGDRQSEIGLAETLREIVAEFAHDRDDLRLRTDLPEIAHLTTNESAVEIAVECALENAVEHAESTVTVALERERDSCVVTITDDGPGIPEAELVPIETGTETNLQHGRGLGLWQLRWSVDRLNGALSFDTDSGTTVRITIPDRRESTPVV